ncbi:MAG: TolC family protein, partial [Salinibacter sp.]
MTPFAAARTLVLFVLTGLLIGIGSVHAQNENAPAPRTATPGDTVRVSLTEAIVRALDASPEVDQRRAQRRFAEARSDEARASRFLTDVSLNTAFSFAPGLTDVGNVSPDFPEELRYLHPSRQNDWSLGALRPFGRFEISVRQPLWTWGKLSGNIRAARHGVDVEAAQVDRKALEVAVRTGKIYYNLLLTKALDQLADRTKKVIDRAKREIKRLLEKGDKSVSQADLYQTRLTEQEYRRRVVEINQNRATARSALRRLLFLPEGTTVVPAAEELRPVEFSVHPDSLDYYVRRALQNRPEVTQAEAGVKARKALVDVAQSNYYPQIGVQASLSQSITLPERPNPDNAFVGDSFMGTGTRTGIGIQQNLNFGQTKARVDQAQAELNKVKHQRTAA